MKKILAMMLTAAMMLSMGTAVFANEGADEGTTPKYTDMTEITFTKTYNAEGSTANSPAETFSFVDDAEKENPVPNTVKFVGATNYGVTYNEGWVTSNLPTISTVSFEEGAAGSDDKKTGTFTITLPDTQYPSVGIYTYTFDEVDNGYEGVTYNGTTMKLVVTVVEEGGYKRIAAVHCEGDTENAAKTNVFTNTYSAGTLSVTKNVTGNLGDKTKEFEITVTFKAGTDGDVVMSNITYTDPDDDTATTIEAGNGWIEKVVKLYMNDGETITFNNIPEGVTYTVEETDLANKDMEGATDTYTASYSGETGTIDADTASEAVVTNNKDNPVDTGISVDSIPYIAMLGVVAIGGTGFIVSKKRRSED